MCSSSKCDLVGLINGPVGDLVGKGIQALVNGAPIGPRTAEASQKSKEPDNIRQFYDNIEAHLKGTLRVLQPALEINRIILGECKSVGHEKPAQSCSIPIVYYTPQNLKKSHVHHCAARCCGPRKTSENPANEKSTSSTQSCSYNTQTTPQSTSQRNESSRMARCSKKLKGNAPKLNFSPINDDTSSYAYENRKSVLKAPKKSCKSKQACTTCNVSLKDNSLLAVLPCKHLFCYTCLAKAKFPKCPKCEKSFDMKNVTQVHTTL